MKLLVTICILLVSISTLARELAGISIPEQQTVDNKILQLNGTGIREKYFLELYICSLYTIDKTEDADRIIRSKHPVIIQLDVLSKLITPETMANGLNEGFKRATNNHIEPLRKRLDRAISLFRNKIVRGDRFQLIIIPGEGVDTIKNGQYRATIKGDDFGRALLKVWLGENPIDRHLKAELLGI